MGRCPTFTELPAAPSGKTGWPWTEESSKLTEIKPAASETDPAGSSPWPTISIVTPSYNQGEFIEETIRSVLLQGYPHLEYIIIDGGSNDDSVQIIKKYARWLKYWISEPDRGQSHAINKGLKYCNGNIFNWINSDDLFAPGALKAVAMAWRKAPDKIITGPVMNFDEKGTENLISPNSLSFENFINFRKAREHKMMWHQPGIFLPLAGISEAGGLQEDISFTMDYFLMIELLPNYDVIYLPNLLAKFRIHNDSKTSTYGFLKFRLERVEKLSKMKEFQRVVLMEELQHEQVSVLLALAEIEWNNKNYLTSCQFRAEALLTSPARAMISLLRRSRIILKIVRAIKSN